MAGWAIVYDDHSGFCRFVAAEGGREYVLKSRTSVMRICSAGALVNSRASSTARGRKRDEAQIEAFVDHYNYHRCYESLNNVTPSHVYFGRDKAILKQGERIKQKTLEALLSTPPARRIMKPTR